MEEKRSTLYNKIILAAVIVIFLLSKYVASCIWDYAPEKTENNYKEAIVMHNELDSMMGFDKLGLYYEVHMAGIEGECFLYHVYLNGDLIQEKTDEVSKAIDEFVNARNDEEHYIGYADVYTRNGELYIFLDIGSAAPEDADTAIYGVLETLNNIDGIDRVIINEEI